MYHAQQTQSLINRIRHSYIKLGMNPSENEVSLILKNFIPFIDKQLDYMTISELSFLITSCFSYYPNQPINVFENFLFNSRNNSNRIIITASLLVVLNQHKNKLPIYKFEFFINDSFKAISKQLNQKEEESLIIFDKTIPKQFKYDFIIDILLLINIKQNEITDFYPFLLNNIKNISSSKIMPLIQKVADNNLISTIPHSLLLNPTVYQHLSMKILSDIIPQLSEKSFKEILPKIESNFQDEEEFNHSFSLAILNKISEFRITFKFINQILNSILPCDMKTHIWEYLSDFKIKLPSNLSKQIKEFPDPVAALIVMPKVDAIPIEVFESGMLLADSFQIYEHVFEGNFNDESYVFSSQQFWTHIISVASTTKDDEEISSKIFFVLSILFNKIINNDYNKAQEILNSMFFYQFPSNNKVNDFLDKFCESIVQDTFHIDWDFLFQKALSQKVLPLPSFWYIFNFKHIQTFNHKDTLMTYAYLFSKKRIYHYAEVIILHQQNDKNEDLILDFISQDNIDNIVNVNEEVLSVITSSLIYLRSKKKPKIQGLTDDLILPFLAISFIYSKNNQKYCNLLFDSNEIKIKNALELLSDNQSLLLNKSIDIIINSDDLLNDNFFPINEAIGILDSLIYFLINDLYYGSKPILLKRIFKLTNINNEKSNYLFKLEGIGLINYLINHLSDLNQITEIKLNLNVFKENEIKDCFINKIENNSSENDLINTLNFIEKFCINSPELFISFPLNLIQILQELIKSENWEIFLLIGQFMNKNNLSILLYDYINEPIPYDIKYEIYDSILLEFNDLISIILTNENPEKYSNLLFKRLMKEKSIVIHYLIYLFECYEILLSIKGEIFLLNFYNEYKLYNDLFFEAVKIVYLYDATNDTFVRNPTIENIPSLPKISTLLTNNLLKQASSKTANFQVFFCLYDLASSFPFLFTKNSIQIFQIVLPKFNNSLIDYLFFKEGTIESIKSEIYCFSFLIKCLLSIEILNDFFPWLIENIESFNESQIFVFLIVLEFLFLLKSVRRIMYLLSNQYNLVNILANLLEKQISDKYKFDFKSCIYNIIYSIYRIVAYMDITKIAYLDEMKTQAKDPFIQHLDNYKSIYSQLVSIFHKAINVKYYSYRIIKGLFNNKLLSKNFYIYGHYRNNKKTNRIDKKEFMNQFLKSEPIINFNDNINLPKIDLILNIKHIRYISDKPIWIYQYLFDSKIFLFQPQHVEILSEIADNLYKLSIKSNDEIDIFSRKSSEYYSKPFCNEKLFNEIIRDFMINNFHFNSNESIFQFFSSGKNILFCFLQQLNSFISNEMNNRINPNRLFIILGILNRSYLFGDYFMSISGNEIIEYSLLPENRNNLHFLNSFVNLFSGVCSKYPSKINDLIAFMFIQNKSERVHSFSIELAFKLCSKINEIDLIDIKPVIELVFDYFFPNKSGNIIIKNKFLSSFLSKFTFLGKTRKSIVTQILDLAINEYQSGHVTNNNIDLICLALNSLAPKTISNQTSFFSDENDHLLINDESLSKIDADGFILKKIPQNLINKDHEFWELYHKHILILNKILKEDGSKFNEMTFLFKYPGLLKFQTRLKFFREKMKDKISKTIKTHLIIDRENILLDSFNYISELEAFEFLRVFEFSFLHEDGIDRGGLTNEWYTLLVKEIMNEDNKLFKITEKNNHQPNPSSTINKNHLEIFKFVGKIIARSIIEEKCINAHFSQSFYKHILQLPIKYKDIEDFDEEIFTSLNEILNNDVEQIGLDFTLNACINGSVETILLKENGDKINVTNENKKEFVELYVNYHLTNAIVDQIKAFCEGFNSMISHEEICYFSPAELDLIICGIPDIDVSDLRNNTVYEMPYSDDHFVIKLFFDVISKWEKENLTKLLLFVTGSSQVPMNGFIDYKNKGKPIKIIPGGEKNRFCVAHTCFNILALPYYENEEEMNEKLLLSIQQQEFELL